MAVAVALRCGATTRLELPDHLSGRLTLPTAGRVRLPGAPGRPLTADVAAGRALITRDGRKATGWTPAAWLGEGHRITLGPLLLTGDQPAADPAVWRELFDRALAGLTRRHQGVAAELGVALRQILPIGTPAGGQTSGTFHHAFGAIATSRPDSPQALALTLAHELQHNKLVAIDHLMPLVRPGCRELYYAPWRNDRRPLIGLIHGVYAHVGVAGFWHGELEAGLSGRAQQHAEVEFARWSAASADVTAGLRENPWLTPAGRDLVRALHSRIRDWKGHRSSVSAMAVADARRSRHRDRWRGRTAPE
ncbi:aKG-HExxH-type peptide beta-hydroxylase [Actinoplanes derwentensis]|uniref:aKG-HExxH-type peptide beta-hydroxylase n=1 Tax=Actinoplanes derwentensis TaxID=113562 RepID=UPI001A3E9E4F|nr:HEXXH motif-containing putative peptide modification protein [Actinoplanes derwentensis]GID89902.1 hypothetical protein Ade03nite_88260 [Actinoplanes derwentensis]